MSPDDEDGQAFLSEVAGDLQTATTEGAPEAQALGDVFHAANDRLTELFVRGLITDYDLDRMRNKVGDLLGGELLTRGLLTPSSRRPVRRPGSPGDPSHDRAPRVPAAPTSGGSVALPLPHQPE